MKITKRQLRRIIREADEIHAIERGMAAAYSQGYNDAYRGPGYKKRGNREYLRGYQQGTADVEQGKPPPDDFRPARRIREADGSTKKYDDDSALKGGQSKLPDGLQKGIIDKTVEDREEHEEEEREEKNESVRITRRQLRRIIREALDTHNISANRAAELMAVLQEFGYSLFIPPATDSNTYAIRDALAAYPGEFTHDELMTAIRVTQGRGA